MPMTGHLKLSSIFQNLSGERHGRGSGGVLAAGAWFTNSAID
jgi:hypothetical protein